MTGCTVQIGEGTFRSALWPNSPLRSELAGYFRWATGGDWRDYFTDEYVDDGPHPSEDCDSCFGTRSEHWEDCELVA